MGGCLKAREREEGGRKEGRGAPQVDRPPAGQPALEAQGGSIMYRFKTKQNTFPTAQIWILAGVEQTLGSGKWAGAWVTRNCSPAPKTEGWGS